MALARYVSEVQDLLNDMGTQFYAEPRIINYVNRARRRIAAVSGCIRVVPLGTQTVPKQEVYPFSAWLPLVQQARPQQIQSILACRSLAIAIGRGGWKPMWRRVPWTDFQARFRIYNGTFFGTISEPGWYAQYGEGPDAALYLAPIPGQIAPMEVDLTLVPSPLLTDQDREPIPYPWTDAVSWWATCLALLGAQRPQEAQAMAQMFNSDMPMCAAVVCPQMIQTPYGAVMRSA